MRKVRDSTIPDANVEADRIDKKEEDPIWHCDGEHLNDCSLLVRDAAQKLVNGFTPENAGNIENFRKSIGEVTHTLQDFYSHSNWIELNNNAPIVNNQMGYGLFDPNFLAGADEATCFYPRIPTFIDYHEFQDYLEANWNAICNTNFLLKNGVRVTNKLTSGYYLGSSGAPINNNVQKCYHGSVFDGLGSLGINKDISACAVGITLSPHHDFNPAAVRAAEQATFEFFSNIREELIKKRSKEGDGEKLFKALLGLGSSVGFAIDTTGSMAQEVSGVKSQVAEIVNKRLGTDDEPLHYVLSQINDPTAPLSIATTRGADFLNALSRLSLYAGGDCPELAGLGTLNAVRAMPSGGSLYVFTDASVKDKDVSDIALKEANDKGITINHALSGSCSPYDPKYFEVSDMTGGQVFIISKKARRGK